MLHHATIEESHETLIREKRGCLACNDSYSRLGWFYQLALCKSRDLAYWKDGDSA